MNRPEDDYASPEAEAGARRMKRILLALPIAFLLLLWAGNAFIRWVWQPPIVIEGRVVDTKGKGVPDVFVIVNHLFDFYDPKASWYVSEGARSDLACAPYSRVLQTDKQGRYHFRISMRDAFGDQRYPSLEWRTPTLKFYKPDWQGSYSLYDQDINGRNVPNPFVMQPIATENIETMLKRFDFIAGQNCNHRVRFANGEKPTGWRYDPSWLSLYQAQYAEIWMAWCGEAGRDNLEPSMFTKIVGRIDWLAYHVDAHQLGLFSDEYSLLRSRQPNRFDGNHHILRQAASSYPWDPDSWNQPTDDLRSFQPQEKAALCETLRFKNYVTEEHRP